MHNLGLTPFLRDVVRSRADRTYSTKIFKWGREGV